MKLSKSGWYVILSFYVSFAPAFVVGGVTGAFFGLAPAFIGFGAVFGLLFVELISRKPKNL